MVLIHSIVLCRHVGMGGCLLKSDINIGKVLHMFGLTLQAFASRHSKSPSPACMALVMVGCQRGAS